MNSRALLAAVLSVCLLGAGACSSGEDKPQDDPKKGESAALEQFSPVNGLPMKKVPSNPVLMVKIENTEGGEPQHGLDQADLVFEELVEGGLTRLAAFYYSTLPTKVGHVRSLRSTDAGIAAPLDANLVASGGAGGAIDVVRRAGVKILSEDEGVPGFSSDPALSRPYNRLVDLTKLVGAAKKTQPSRSILPWGTSNDPGTSKVTKAKNVDVRFSPGSVTQWRRSAGGSAWVRANGHAAQEFAAANLVVLFADVSDVGYRDPAGNPVPETVVKGSGRAFVIGSTDAVELTWSKKDLNSSISLKTADGKPYEVKPGKTFVELVPKNGGGIQLR